MSLQGFLYGDKEPTPVHQIMTGIIVVSFLLATYGLLAEFIPDRGWTQGGGFFSLCLLLILILGARAIESDSGQQRFYVSSASRAETWLAGGIRSVFYLSTLWLAFVHGFAALYTGTFGDRYTMDVEVSKQRSNFAMNCDYQLTADSLQSGATQHVCISQSQFYRLPERAVVRLEGQRSVLGRTVSRVNPAASESAAP